MENKNFDICTIQALIHISHTYYIYIIYIYYILYIYIYIHIYIILSRINRTTMNLLLKVSHFFHDFQVNVLFTKIFLVLEALAINWKSLRKGEFCSIATIRVN